MSKIATPENVLWAAEDIKRHGDQRWGGIPDAPNDGKMYGRLGRDWVEVESGTVPQITIPQVEAALQNAGFNI